MITVNNEITATQVKVSFWPEDEEIVMSLEETLNLANSMQLDLQLAEYITPNLARCYIRDISQYLYNELFDANLAKFWKKRYTQNKSHLRFQRYESSLSILKDENYPSYFIEHSQKISQEWEAGRYRANTALLEAVGLPVESKKFLNAIGLPKRGWNHIDFNFDNYFFNLSELIQAGKQADEKAYNLTLERLKRDLPQLERKYYDLLPIDFSQYWHLGRSRTQTMVIEQTTGKIYIMDVEGRGDEIPIQFINSRVEYFGEFIYLFDKLYDRIAGKEEVLGKDEINYLEAKFREIDPETMLDDQLGYWPNQLWEAANMP
jgi:hypothetical protein